MKTPQLSFPDLAKALGIQEIYLKREDQHKYGSHKGRSIPIMIKKYVKEEGVTNFVISSSGNAALAGICAVQAHNRNNPNPISLTVFVGQNINEKKLNVLKTEIDDPRVKLEQTERPKQEAFQTEKDGTTKFLRQSTDDNALTGYTELAQELDKIPELQAIFIPTSSGTTAQALGEAFATLTNKPQIHIVQTTTCHPIASVIARPSEDEAISHQGDTITQTESSIADAIVDNIAHRKDKVVEVIKNSHGSGWIVTDDEISSAVKLVGQTCNLAISPNSALSVAGLAKAVENGWKWDGPVVSLITGR